MCALVTGVQTCALPIYLVGMGVLPLQFKGADSVESLGITGEETYDISGLENGIKPMQDVTLTITRKDGSKQDVTVLLRIDTPIEVDYYLHGDRKAHV